MDFEPFQSDDDEELASIMPEKKKRDGDKWKKSKGGPLFRNEKKMTYNDSPQTIKVKHSVHGVVGPADYIYDQGSSSAADPSPPTLLSQALSHTSTGLSSDTHTALQTNINVVTAEVSRQQNVALLQKSPAKGDVPSQKLPARPDLPQPAANPVMQSFSAAQLSPASQFQPNFPPASNTPIKIDRDRPHFSPAALPQLPTLAQGPTPFKHHPQVAKSVTITQFQEQPSVQSHPSIQQTTPIRNAVFQRNQSFPQTAPLSSPVQDIGTFTPNYDTSASSQEYLGSSEAVDSCHKGAWQSDIKHSPSSPDFGDTEWANFRPSPSSLLQDPYDADNDENRRKSRGTDSFSESIPESVSSLESELDDSVWKINNEQREYYTKQFTKIQPDISEVIKGPQARDFFLKSNLPNEILSTIWQLSDMDKDAALNLNEFCIAMHLVVAVKHGVELPQSLPQRFVSYCDDGLLSNEVEESIEECDDDNKNSSISDDASLSSNEVTPTMSEIISEQSIIRSSSINSDDSRERTSSLDHNPTSPSRMNQYTPSKDNTSNQRAIARPRASVQKSVDLMDSSPWQLLPPPSTKGKTLVTKILNLDDDATFTSNESIEQVNTLNNSEEITKRLHSVDDSGYNEDSRANKTLNKSNANLMKEKSRSIDSLRLDMNEDYTCTQMRRLSRESRPRSFSGDVPHTNGSQHNAKEMEVPPIPPPREKGHARAFSLDYRLLTSNKTSDASDSLKSKCDDVELLSTTKTCEDSQLSVQISVSSLIQDENKSVGSNLEVNVNVNDAVETPSPTSIISNSPRSNRSPKVAGGESVKHVVRFSDKLDVHDDQANAAKSIDKKMRKHELQARVRMLKSSNTTLNNLISQLHLEWKAVAEERIALDIMLQKEKQELS